MKKTLAIAVAFAVPGVAFAQEDIEGILGIVKGLLDAVVPILIVLALIYFIYGVAKYITSSGDAEGQAGARSIMIWGIIALFAIVSVWALVGILQGTFTGGGSGSTPTLPSVGGVGG